MKELNVIQSFAEYEFPRVFGSTCRCLVTFISSAGCSDFQDDEGVWPKLYTSYKSHSFFLDVMITRDLTYFDR